MHDTTSDFAERRSGPPGGSGAAAGESLFFPQNLSPEPTLLVAPGAPSQTDTVAAKSMAPLTRPQSISQQSDKCVLVNKATASVRPEGADLLRTQLNISPPTHPLLQQTVGPPGFDVFAVKRIVEAEQAQREAPRRKSKVMGCVAFGNWMSELGNKAKKRDGGGEEQRVRGEDLATHLR